MEPIWRLAESVPLTESFDLTTSWTLDGFADDWLFSDFLGAGIFIGRHTELSGQYKDEQKIAGQYKDEQKLSG